MSDDRAESDGDPRPAMSPESVEGAAIAVALIGIAVVAGNVAVAL